ncbi:hypothetical protein MSPP1_001175 [Malassezia sp. CBS 17886]|nr:hypothetical protein MSPP1_001175 [Malassezia sp. CBS 17886]
MSRSSSSVQVGGHIDAVTAFSDGRVLKRCAAPEAQFYAGVWAEPPRHPAAIALRTCLPRCFGVVDADGEWHPCAARTPMPVTALAPPYVILEDLTSCVSRADICDVKLGSVLYDETDPTVPRAKRERMQRKAAETTSGSLGLRITGWRVWDAATRTHAYVGKGPGRAARARADVAALWAAFLGTSGASRHAALRRRLVAEYLVPTLASLRERLARVPAKFRGASLLVVLEADDDALAARLADRTAPAVLRVIDLAHSRWDSAPDEGIQRALMELQKIWEEGGGVSGSGEAWGERNGGKEEDGDRWEGAWGRGQGGERR